MRLIMEQANRREKILRNTFRLLAALVLALNAFAVLPAQNTWACFYWSPDQFVPLQAGAQIFIALGSHSPGSAIVLESEKTVQLVSGPDFIDNQEWWQVSWTAAGDTHSGWVIKEQAADNPCPSIQADVDTLALSQVFDPIQPIFPIAGQQLQDSYIASPTGAAPTHITPDWMKSPRAERSNQESFISQDSQAATNPGTTGIENHLTLLNGEMTYLPLVLYSYHPSGLVTNNGVPVASTMVELDYFNGVNWTTLSTTWTDLYGAYQFTNYPTLTAGQMLSVRWNNPTANSSLLKFFWCNSITSTSPESAYTCNFDVKNIQLTSPADGSIVPLPQTFNWLNRGFTNETYVYNLFEPGDGNPWYWTDPLGNTNSFTLNTLPVGFFPGVQYGWNLEVYTPVGYGASYYYARVTFGGASGRVTLNGEPFSGTPVLLVYFNGSSWTTYATKYTNSNGDYAFNSLPPLGGSKKFYVRWNNPNFNKSLLSSFSCNIVDHSSPSSALSCNFDIKNIPLKTPPDIVEIILPQKFTWTNRGFSNESYAYNLFDPIDQNPWWQSPFLGNVSNYTLPGLPAFFSYGQLYGWFVTFQTSHGVGVSYNYFRLTFRP